MSTTGRLRSALELFHELKGKLGLCLSCAWIVLGLSLCFVPGSCFGWDRMKNIPQTDILLSTHSKASFVDQVFSVVCSNNLSNSISQNTLS